MVQKQSISLNIKFLEKNLNILIEKKEHCFSPLFLEQLENTAFELLEAMNQQKDFIAIPTQLAPTKISESFIDLCFKAIAGQIKKLDLSVKNNTVPVMKELRIIAYDLFCLLVYIRFTLDPIGTSLSRKIIAISGEQCILDIPAKETLN